MAVYNIPVSNSTPSVFIDTEVAFLEIVGKLYHVDPVSFFNKINNKLSKIQTNCIKVSIDLIYINSVASKHLLHMFNHIKVCCPDEIDIKWYVDEEDKDLREYVQIMSNILNIPINIIFNIE